ncbi:MAG: hypothetical protein ACI4QV_00935, partial [Acutalibacteraceae bacterium]
LYVNISAAGQSSVLRFLPFKSCGAYAAKTPKYSKTGIYTGFFGFFESCGAGLSERQIRLFAQYAAAAIFPRKTA